MSSWSSLNRSKPPIWRYFSQIRRLQSRQLSSPSGASNQTPNHNNRDHNALLLKLISGIIAGSGLGFWYYLSSNTSDSSSAPNKSFLSFAGWSNATTEVIDDVIEQSIPEESPKFLFGDAFRRKIFFNYEKRIRMRSSPEKVFEYFASFRNQEGEVFMTPADLMRAVVPVFPPSESNLVRDGYLRGERSPGDLRCPPSEFFMLFDVNKDGLISFKEYIFFVTLLSLPESSFSVAFKMFDISNDGEIHMEEFKKVMGLMQAHNRQGKHQRGGLRTGLRVGHTVENGGLIEYFFGKDGKRRLKHDNFVQFLRRLRDEILDLEFAHYDYKIRGSISAKDFALSMVASADMNHLNKLLDRVDEIASQPHLCDISITREEFRSFAELRGRLQPFSLALLSYGEVNGLLTKKDFQRAASQVCGVFLSDSVIDIIFHVFDINRDGSLSSVELVRVLEKRERDIGQPMEPGIFGFFSCLSRCTESCSIARYLS
ncbi:EF-hand domain [Dillenia turbinata]|uniref:EF-hand domain n=1 Tax=Dillenia turbinata TaxID=194707 RepID=A0AAN8ZBI2_9MAGN